jgi:hypothetical protein
LPLCSHKYQCKIGRKAGRQEGKYVDDVFLLLLHLLWCRRSAASSEETRKEEKGQKKEDNSHAKRMT